MPGRLRGKRFHSRGHGGHGGRGPGSDKGFTRIQDPGPASATQPSLHPHKAQPQERTSHVVLRTGPCTARSELSVLLCPTPVYFTDGDCTDLLSQNHSPAAQGGRERALLLQQPAVGFQGAGPGKEIWWLTWSLEGCEHPPKQRQP